MGQLNNLSGRLNRIWRDANFGDFFENFSSRPKFAVKKGTILFNEGEPLNKIFYIKNGFIKLYRLSSEGRETTIYLFGPGEIVGVRALTSEDECARHFAEAITDLEVLTMTRFEYFDVLKDHPDRLIDLLHVFINRLNYTERKLEGFIITDSTARVAFFLHDIALRFCKGQTKNFDLPLQLTHQRIAEFVGSFRETVTLALNKLEKEGVLTDQRGRITIKDVAKLNKTAHSAKN